MSDFINSILSRENEIIRLIKLFSDSKLDFIVVGGYAVSVYKKRFSVDLDIVIKEDDLNKFASLLENEGYASGYSKDISMVYGEKFRRFEKNLVSVDLLINGLVSRLTGGSWSYNMLPAHSTKGILQGAEFMMPVKELLIAMKIHSGRFSDARDIVALYENTDHDVILGHAKRGDIKTLKAAIQKEINFIESPNFTDSFKGIFGFHVYREQDIEIAAKGLRAILKKL